MLDVFSESVVLESDEENCIVQIETFEDGFLQWVLSQKENVVVLQPLELREKICVILEETLKKYQEMKSGGKDNEDV